MTSFCFEQLRSLHRSSLGRPQCFSLNDTARTPYGEDVTIDQLQVGQKVLAVDGQDRIVPTEIVALLHYDNQKQGKFSRNAR